MNKFLLSLVIATTSFVSIDAQTVTYNGLEFIPETTPVYVPATQAAMAKPGYTLIWSDEFEYTSISQLNTKWNLPSYAVPGIDTYHQVVASTTSFVTNDQNTKSIRLKANKLSPPHSSGMNWEAAQINTFGKKHFIYGYYEARIKVTNGQGSWPSFWLYGNNGFSNGEGGSSYAGSYNEIDIIEFMPTREYSKSGLHNGYSWHYDQNGVKIIDSYLDMVSLARTYSGDMDYSEEYHIYGMDFTPTAVTFYVDNIIVGTITSPASIAKLRKNAMWLVLGTATNPDYIDYSTPSTHYMDVDYVRIYEKSSVLSLGSHTCTSGNITTLNAAAPEWFSTLPNGKTITYQWTVSGTGVTISGASNTSTVTISNPNNVVFTASCQTTVTHPDWAVATATSTITQTVIVTSTFQYPNNIFSNVFNIGVPQCVGSSIYVTATGVTNPPGGLWQLWNTDANGNFIGSPLQSGYGNNITFTGLQMNVTYAITRGVWDGCTPWSFVQKNFKATLSEFTLSSVTCTPNINKFQVTCTALNNIANATWQLWPCDANGVVPPNSTPVNGSGLSYTFNNLNPDSYYKIIRNEQSNCSGGGASTTKVFYVPNYTLDQSFDATVTGDPNSVNFTVTGNNAIPSLYSWWGVYNSNAAGDPLSQIGNMISGGSATFGPSNGYYLYDGSYYLLVHAAYSDCAPWNWKGYLIYNTLRQSGSEVVEEFELDSLQIAMLQNPFKCYPNPADDNLTVEVPPSSSGYRVDLVNSLGQTVLSSEFVESKFTLNLETYDPGVYILRVTDGVNNYTKTVIRN